MNNKKRNDSEQAGYTASKVFTAVNDLACDAYREMEHCCKHACDISGITSGFENLDSATDGIHRGEVVVIGGRISMGKTSLALNLAVNIAKSDQRYSVAMLSLDKSLDQIIRQILAMNSGIEINRLQRGNLTTEDWRLLAVELSTLDQCQLILSSLNDAIEDMDSIFSCLKDEAEKLDVLLIDDLQALAEQIGIRHTTHGIAEIMHSLKVMAKSMHIAVVVTAHIKPDVESRTVKRPMISDLYHAAAIERAADVIMLLYRDELYHPKPDNEGLAEINIAKQGHGGSERIALSFEGRFSRFSDAGREFDFDADEPSSQGRNELDEVYAEVFQAQCDAAISHPYNIDTSLHPDDDD